AAQPSQATPPAASVTPAPETPAVSAVAAADQPAADALRELVTSKRARMTDRKADRAAIEAFYSGRSYAPLWISNGAATANAKAAIARLGNAADDGLDAADYPVPAIKAG